MHDSSTSAGEATAMEGLGVPEDEDGADPTAGQSSTTIQVLANLKKLAERLSELPQGHGAHLEKTVHAAAHDDMLRHPDHEVRKQLSLCLAEALYVFAPKLPFPEEQTQAVLELFLEQLGALLELGAQRQSDITDREEPDSPDYEHAADLLDRIQKVQGWSLIYRCRDADELMTRQTRLLVGAARTSGGSKQNELFVLIEQGLEGLLVEAETLPKEVVEVLMNAMMPQYRGTHLGGLVRFILGKLADRLCVSSINSYVNDALLAAAQGDSSQVESLYVLVYELFEVDPDLVTRVLPTVYEDLECPDAKRRCYATKSTGRMLACIKPQDSPTSRSALVVTTPRFVTRLLERLEDGEEDVRLAALDGAGALLIEAAKHASHDQFFLEGNWLVSEKHVEDAPSVSVPIVPKEDQDTPLAQAAAWVVQGLQARIIDPSDTVRLRVVEIAAKVAQTRGGFRLLESMLPRVFRRILDKKLNVREGCIWALGRLYAQHALPRASRPEVTRFELRFACDWRESLAARLNELGIPMQNAAPMIAGSVKVKDVGGSVWDVFAEDATLPDKKNFPLRVECKREVAAPGFHCPSCRRSWAPGEEPDFGICHCHAEGGTKLEDGMLDSPMAVDQIAWAPQCLCEAYTILSSSQIGPTRQLEECLEKHVLGCGLPARERAVAMAKLYASVAGHEAAERGFNLLLARKRDANEALRRFVQLRLAKSAPLLQPARSPALVPPGKESGQASGDTKPAASSAAALEAGALLALLARQSPVIEDRNCRPENYIQDLRSFDKVKNRDLWTLLSELLGTEAAGTTSELVTQVAELNRLLRTTGANVADAKKVRVHNLENTLAPLLRRALLCTWLLPDQVISLLEIWSSDALSSGAGRVVEEMPRYIPGAFLPHVGAIAEHLKEASTENARIALRALGALGKRATATSATVFVKTEDLLRAAARVATAAQDGSAFRKALRCLGLLSKKKFWNAFKQVVRWARQPPGDNAEAITLRLMAACMERVADSTDCPEEISALVSGEEWLARARSSFQSGLEGQHTDVCKAAVELYAAAGAESEILDLLDGEEHEVDVLSLHAASYALRALRRHVVPLTTQLLSRLTSQIYKTLFSARAAEDAEVLLRALLKFQKLTSDPRHTDHLRLAATLPSIFAFAPVKRHREAAQHILQGSLSRAARQQTESREQKPLLDYAAACFVHFLSRVDCFVKEASQAVTKYPESSLISQLFVHALLRIDTANRVILAAAVCRVTQRVNLFVDREDPTSDRVHKASWVLRYILEKECPELGAQETALATGAARGTMPEDLFAVRKVEASTQPVLVDEVREVEVIAKVSTDAAADSHAAAAELHVAAAAKVHVAAAAGGSNAAAAEVSVAVAEEVRVAAGGSNAAAAEVSVAVAEEVRVAVATAGHSCTAAAKVSVVVAEEVHSAPAAAEQSHEAPADASLAATEEAHVASTEEDVDSAAEEEPDSKEEDNVPGSGERCDTDAGYSLSCSSDVPVPLYATPREPVSITPRRISFGSSASKNSAAARDASAGLSSEQRPAAALERSTRSGESSGKAKRPRHS